MQKILIPSKENIELLCSFINKVASIDEKLDDLHIRSDGTFSSYKIDLLLQALKTDCNYYTDSIVANLNRLTLKVVTDEAEITESNTMYLYKPDGQTSYNQYVVVDGTKVLLGTTDISMSDYYSITQADAKFVLKTDYDSLVAKIGDTTTLVTNDKSSIINAINECAVTKIDKTSISTTIDNTCTDDQIASAKAVYDIIPTDTHIKEISLLGEKVADTTKYGADILYFPCGVYIFESNAIANNFTNAPVKQAGTFYVTSIVPNKDMNTNEFVYRNYRYETYYGEIYTRSLMKGSTSDGIRRDSGWVRVCNTKDIVTTIDDTCTDNQIASAKAVNDSTPKFMRRGTRNTNMPKGSDLNNYITPGTYTCIDTNTAKTLLNCPYNGGNFRLFVIQNTGADNQSSIWGWQKIVTGHVASTKVWYRSIYTNNSTVMFGTWDRVCTTKVVNISKTAIVDDSKFTYDSSSNLDGIAYCVYNGWCEVKISGVTMVGLNETLIKSDFPEPELGFTSAYLMVATNTAIPTKPASVYVKNKGLYINTEESFGAFWGTLVYKVKES